MHQNFKEMIPNLPEDMLSISDIPSFYDASFLGHIHWKKNLEIKYQIIQLYLLDQLLQHR